MEPDEIRAEIERRKTRAKELNVGEILWGLYYGRLSRYSELIDKDPPRVYPDVRGTFGMSVLPSTKSFPKGTLLEFKMGTTPYQILYREGPEEVRDTSGRAFSRYSVTPASIALSVDGADVFEFNIRRSVRDEEWGPVFDNSMGEITRFVEGPWVLELTDLLRRIKEHEKSLSDQRDIPRLEMMKKRFGL